MTGIDRRQLMGGLMLATSVAAARRAQAMPAEVALKDLKKEGEVACVYHCDFGDAKRFDQMIGNIANHYSVYGGDPFAVQLAVVAHGAGVKFFLSDLDGTPWKDEKIEAATFERVANVAKTGLKVHLCAITFAKLNIDKAKARSEAFISFVPSGVAAVGALQSNGFGYIKVG